MQWIRSLFLVSFVRSSKKFSWSILISEIKEKSWKVFWTIQKYVLELGSDLWHEFVNRTCDEFQRVVYIICPVSFCMCSINVNSCKLFRVMDCWILSNSYSSLIDTAKHHAQSSCNPVWKYIGYPRDKDGNSAGHSMGKSIQSWTWLRCNSRHGTTNWISGSSGLELVQGLNTNIDQAW
jgi:hypothetical protein